MPCFAEHTVPHETEPLQVCGQQAARAAGALALAPLVKRLLATVQARLRLHSTRAAFAMVLAACLVLALLVFVATAAVFF